MIDQEFERINEERKEREKQIYDVENDTSDHVSKGDSSQEQQELKDNIYEESIIINQLKNI